MTVALALLEVVPLRIPLRHPIDHNLTARRESRPQIVRATLSDGTIGYGEALPRPYLTGETETSVQHALAGELAALALGRTLGDLASTAAWLVGAECARARAGSPAAFCALELALLDAAGRRERRSIADILGPVRRTELAADVAVVGFLPRAACRFYLQALTRRPVRTIKLKVGRDDDLERAELVREVMGTAVALTVDANGAWSADQAIARIRALERFGVASVEQPVAKDDVDGLATVRRHVAVPLVADESICTEADAHRLIASGACDAWNLRVGKCGGILMTVGLAALAARHGIDCHVGMLVGETGILRRARRLFAACAQEIARVESDGGGLLREDILDEPLAHEADGRLTIRLDEAGLGVRIDEGALRRLSGGASAATATDRSPSSAVVPAGRTSLSSAN